MLWLSIILLPLFAALWILALLAVNDAIEELHYAYSFLTFASSLYIFVGYCLVNRRVRISIQHTWQRLITIIINTTTTTGTGGGTRSPGSDESISGTRTSVSGALYHQQQQQPPFQQQQQQYGGSNYDIYGLRGHGVANVVSTKTIIDPAAILNGQGMVSSSSTTSRSTITKGSSGQMLDQIDGVIDGLGIVLDSHGEDIDTEDSYSGHRGRGHRHHHHHHRHGHKCHHSRRHRHHRGHFHRHHRSKQSLATGTDTGTGSSDDADALSYNDGGGVDRSMELASSHSSDDEEMLVNNDDGRTRMEAGASTSAPGGNSLAHPSSIVQNTVVDQVDILHENQINQIIAEHHKQQPALYGTNLNHNNQRILSSSSDLNLQQKHQNNSSTDSSLGANTVIYGQQETSTTNNQYNTIPRPSFHQLSGSVSESGSGSPSSAIVGGTIGIPAILKQDLNNPSQAQLVMSLTASPFSRSNILAMTAGLSDGHNHSSNMINMTNVYSTSCDSGFTKTTTTTTVEHIYSYARKPTTVIAPVLQYHQQQQSQPQNSSFNSGSNNIYSTIGPQQQSSVCGDGDIGLPPIPPSLTTTTSTQIQNSALRLAAFNRLENPYGTANSISSYAKQQQSQSGINSMSSHVRLLANPTTNPTISTDYQQQPHYNQHHYHYQQQEQNSSPSGALEHQEINSRFRLDPNIMPLRTMAIVTTTTNNNTNTVSQITMMVTSTTTTTTITNHNNNKATIDHYSSSSTTTPSTSLFNNNNNNNKNDG